MNLLEFILFSIFIYGFTFFVFTKTKIYFILKLLLFAFIGGQYLNIIEHGEDGAAVKRFNLLMSDELLIFSIFMFILYIITVGKFVQKYKTENQ